MPTLLATCVVGDLRPDKGTVGITAIDKRPTVGPIKLRRLGLHADVQADRKHHGGEDKALYVYAQEDADFWTAELARELPAGWFGENLRVSGLDVSNARVGERWRIGGTVEVEVTMPRSPCATFASWVGGADERGWVKRFATEGRLGAYLRVIRTGQIAAGDEIEILSSPRDAPTVLEVFRA
ncbi:MOSC domain-containing protein [Glaciihabitans sp. INWT7]|uniref:MOSC domain-containing protein n=1 Tax=Glaciihabitans sp. INWT7 TaxID=2596912 RepID=UPI0016276E01|nr:MOSC domain-containing protein [Glaciihabitans sp. INWT7]QNE46579.1 MOSC domain-containing protein [Glaciihabitans sp. INWT7]